MDFNEGMFNTLVTLTKKVDCFGETSMATEARAMIEEIRQYHRGNANSLAGIWLATNNIVDNFKQEVRPLCNAYGDDVRTECDEVLGRLNDFMKYVSYKQGEELGKIGE